MNTVFSDNLKKFRKQKQYTQEYVAEKLGVSVHTVSRWECNTTLPDVTILPEIAKLYCVSVDDFFKESSVAYENYAQRLASVFESTHNPEDFIRADMEFKKLQKSNALSAYDMWEYGVMHQIMMNYCIEKAFYWFDKVLEKGKEADAFAYKRTRAQRMKLCFQTGKGEESIKEQQENLKINPDDVNEHCLMIAAYMFANRNNDAFEQAQQAIALFPDEWEPYIHAGDICKRLKRYDEAFMYWDKAEEIGCYFMDGKYSKAYCYEELEQYENAYKAWCELAEELKEKGFDVEAEMPIQRAEMCRERI